MYRCFNYFCAGFLCFVLGFSHTCVAGEQTNNQIRNFDLPSDALTSAIIEFALQAQVTVVADQALLLGKRSAPLIGPLQTASALEALLAYTSLQAIYSVESESFIIQKKPAELLEQAQDVNAEIIAASTEEVVVTAPQYPFRYSTITNTQTLGDIPYFDSARFLNVLPSALIQDQQALDMAEVLKYASAVTPADGFSDSNDDMVIRGFERHAIYVDGYRLSPYTGVKLMPVSVSQVEILKGPSTVYYGQAEPGGIANFARKKPEKQTQVNTTIGTGSEGLLYGDLDTNLAAVDNLQMRFTLAGEKRANEGDVNDLQHALASGAVTWQPTQSTHIELGYHYQSSAQSWDRDVIALTSYGDQFPGASVGELTHTARDGYESKFNLFNVSLSHYFNEDWRLFSKVFAHQEYRYGIRNTNEHMLQPGLLFDKAELGDDFFILIPGGQVSIPVMLDVSSADILYSLAPVRSLYDEDEEDSGAALDVRLIGHATTGSVHHRLAFGGSFQTQQVYKRQLVEVMNFRVNEWHNEYDFGSVLLEGFDFIVDPQREPGNFESLRQQLNYSESGLFVQDSMEITDRLLLSMGTRYTQLSGEQKDLSVATTTILPEYAQFSSQLGAVYRLGDQHSLFGNYSESLRANYRIDDLASQIDAPETSHQFEFGIKSLLFDGRLISSLAYFDIEKNNVIDVRVYEGVRTLVVGDDHSAQGIDLDISWQILPNFSVIAAYAWLDATVTTGEYAGNRTPLSTRQASSVFAHYRMFDAFTLSVGGNHVGGRYADLENSYYLHGYTTWDASVAYELSSLPAMPTIKFSVKNLSNTIYHTAIVSGVRENYSAGRSFFASLELAF